jgi:Fur family transcriptional regulator, peroxide stress response regulator
MALTQQDIDERMTAFVDACRREGVKVTYQRMEIFREVASTEEHPDADHVYRGVRARIPTVSLDTVYRALSLLEKLGVVSRVHVFSDRARFDANTQRHHHFVCHRCGLIKDFSSPEADGFHIPEDVRAVGRIESVHLEVRGVCCSCASLPEPSDEGIDDDTDESPCCSRLGEA